jgi:hypothetical protein
MMSLSLMSFLLPIVEGIYMSISTTVLTTKTNILTTKTNILTTRVDRATGGEASDTLVEDSTKEERKKPASK